MRSPLVSSIVERRLLVNYRVEAEIASLLLPAPLRPRQVGGWAVAGICLIRLGGLRPRWAPGAFGLLGVAPGFSLPEPVGGWVVPPVGG